MQALSATSARRCLLALATRDTPSVRALRRQWSKILKTQPAAQVWRLTKPLLKDASWAARLLAYELIAHHPAAFAALNDRRLASMASGLNDWGCVDAFAVTLSGPAWREGQLSTRQVRSWARSPDRWLRRLALVSTVRLVRSDPCLDICRRLRRDRDPMVVKALSWALRALAKRDPDSVKQFMLANDATLAALVRREVRNKLNLGTKSGQ